ncbi:hypothetical protein BBO99_00005092 [Phytophthora kernoviae]|uniref:Uncharacterized protein n=2 Tax=Phytophthora kernoviae TaxID=325452 RepID=A0A3R7JZ67_9STRA|nr:hypothetical protein G195_005551 [Phytophthora kernoviae 00238/432]KAG2523520.1 hypothetical protein JM16_004801 [Phytophthora kernoviae]KAG2525369.1 hypothetical protein JM18_004414 [Phytophthora kernoviae]RLN21437.1 hypothetical protein BBI17_005179 [Phytophthora kernoviae]RLN79692.1 hypothetical protein BBO99_00005092 [Phytophthora kernoviae]
MDLESDVIQDAAFCTCMGVLVSPPVNLSAQQRDGIRARQSNVTLGSLLAFLAVFGRVVVAPLMLAIVFGLTSYLAPAKMFIGPDESYFAFSFKDAVMVGGCTGCQIGCLKTILQLSFFENETLMSKPLFENLFTMSEWNYFGLSSEAIALAEKMESDGTVCIGGVDEWGSPLTTFKGTPQMVVEVVKVLNLSVVPQAFLEATHAVKNAKCPTDWVLEAHLRLFKFPAAKASTDFSAVSVADFTIFPERTECRPNISNNNLVESRLALATGGIDLLVVVPDILKLFPYDFTNNLPHQPRTILASGVPGGVLQPLLHAYYGGCRVREVNSIGVYIENTCTIDKHWVNYGLMVQAPDNLPVCSTGDVCVHNYYNSLWEFVTEVDSSAEDRLAMALNIFRSRLYLVMFHKRSALLTQIWAYRLFTDCDDIAYIKAHNGVQCSTVEVVLLTGYLFYGEHVYRAQDVVLLLLTRLLPRKFTRTFNVLFVRWHLNKRTGCVSYPQSCTWYHASEDAFRLMEARPIT